MQDLTVNWRDKSMQVMDLTIGCLHQLGATSVNKANFTVVTEGKTFVVPHRIWAEHGLSGASVPPTIVIDYADQIFALIPDERVGEFIREARDECGQVKAENWMHYGTAESLCGQSKAVAGGEVSSKISSVTCPHCMLEIGYRMTALSNTLN